MSPLRKGVIQITCFSSENTPNQPETGRRIVRFQSNPSKQENLNHIQQVTPKTNFAQQPYYIKQESESSGRSRTCKHKASVYSRLGPVEEVTTDRKQKNIKPSVHSRLGPKKDLGTCTILKIEQPINRIELRRIIKEPNQINEDIVLERQIKMRHLEDKISNTSQKQQMQNIDMLQNNSLKPLNKQHQSIIHPHNINIALDPNVQEQIHIVRTIDNRHSEACSGSMCFRNTGFTGYLNERFSCLA